MHPTRRPTHKGILVLDYGSQYTLLIARRFREVGVYAEVIDGQASAPPAGFNIEGIVLSGGPDSVTESSARKIPNWVIQSGRPILGICYGMQLILNEFGGVVRSGNSREYGSAKMQMISDLAPRAAQMFYDTPVQQMVWMSHGDDVESLPSQFLTVGKTEDGVCAAAVHRELPIVCLQFHPEVQHSEFGLQLLRQFAKFLCRCDFSWQANDMFVACQNYIRETVGDGKVVMAVSGGVDSTVAAVLLTKTLGPDRVCTVFVDHGLLRHNERQWVEDNLKFLGVKNLEVLERKELFLGRLKGIVDPEEKRKIIGRTFIEVFEEFAHAHTGFTHLGQGTLYPDVIESAGHGAGAKVIKSHHNVGGLPERLHLKLVEPFRYFFKDEVRVVGKELAINPILLGRHPFPGPGLSIRILGEINNEDLEILRAADNIFIDALRGANLYDEVWQAFAVLLPVKSVGVMGDNRSYQKTIALRAVDASDGMTAGVSELPMEFLAKVAGQIVRKVDGINRVVYDLTSKPPATIEWE